LSTLPLYFSRGFLEFRSEYPNSLCDHRTASTDIGAEPNGILSARTVCVDDAPPNETVCIIRAIFEPMISRTSRICLSRSVHRTRTAVEQSLPSFIQVFLGVCSRRMPDHSERRPSPRETSKVSWRLHSILIRQSKSNTAKVRKLSGSNFETMGICPVSPGLNPCQGA
jgi:hypothetical protein